MKMNMMRGCGLDSTSSEQDTAFVNMVGEILIKCRLYLDYLSYCQLLKDFAPWSSVVSLVHEGYFKSINFFYLGFTRLIQTINKNERTSRQY
jgi:hypothetical protein